MNIKKLGIIGITLLSMFFLSSCKGNSGDTFSATVVDDIIENVADSEVLESVSSETKPEDILSSVVFFTEESLENVEDSNSNTDSDTDSDIEENDSKNNTLGELADVPEGF